MLTYDSLNHRYFWNEKEVPGVNHILKMEGISPNFSKFPNAEYKRQLGQYVHTAIKLYYNCNLDENSLLGTVKNYFEGFKKFINEHNLIPDMVEEARYSQKWGYAGTLDWKGAMDGKQVLLDWKCSNNIYPTYELTLPAYAELINDPIEEFYLVQLKPFDYKLVKMKINKQNWLAILFTYKFKEERRLYESNR